MSNVTTLFENTNAIDSLRLDGYGDADFGIHTTPLYYNAESNKGITTNGWRSSKYATYRTDTGEELGVHGERYQAIRPRDMIEHCRKILERSDFNLDGITEKIATSHNGSRTFVQYNLPNNFITTPDGDTATLGLLAITSFDSSWPFMISAAAQQQACLNLQVFVSGEVAVFKSRHTRGLNLNAGTRIIGQALDMMTKESELWYKWSTTEVSDIKALHTFAKVLKLNTVVEKITNTQSINKTFAEIRDNKDLNYLWNVWNDVYRNRLGNNGWALYNSLTDWSTHAPARSKSQHNIASIKNNRQEKIRKYFVGNQLMVA